MNENDPFDSIRAVGNFHISSTRQRYFNAYFDFYDTIIRPHATRQAEIAVGDALVRDWYRENEHDPMDILEDIGPPWARAKRRLRSWGMNVGDVAERPDPRLTGLQAAGLAAAVTKSVHQVGGCVVVNPGNPYARRTADLVQGLIYMSDIVDMSDSEIFASLTREQRVALGDRLFSQFTGVFDVQERFGADAAGNEDAAIDAVPGSSDLLDDLVCRKDINRGRLLRLLNLAGLDEIQVRGALPILGGAASSFRQAVHRMDSGMLEDVESFIRTARDLSHIALLKCIDVIVTHGGSSPLVHDGQLNALLRD